MEFFLLILLGALASNADSDKAGDVVASKPDVVVQAPDGVVEAPQDVVEAPQLVEIPKAIVEAPKDVVEAPKAVSEVPEVVVEAPKAIVEAPDAVAEPQMTLSLFSGRDQGVKTTSLSFGVPETDNVMFNASCRSDDKSASSIAFDLLTSFGGAANLANVNLVMRSKGAVQSYVGTFRVYSEEYAAGSFQLAVDDPVLVKAAQTGVLSFGTEIGVPALEAEFLNSKSVFQQFLSDCVSHAQIAKSEEATPAPVSGGAEDGQTEKFIVDDQSKQAEQAGDKVAVVSDPAPILWRRERVDLGDFNEADKGLRGSILTATPSGQSIPIFRAYCSEYDVDTARTRMQFFSETALRSVSEEQDVYLKFVAGDEHVEQVLKKLDATFTGRVVKFSGTSAVQLDFGADSRFWSAIQLSETLLYQVNPEEERVVPLEAAGRNLTKFRNDCLFYDDIAKARAEKAEAEKKTSEAPATAPTTTQSADNQQTPADGGGNTQQPQVATVQPVPETTKTAEPTAPTQAPVPEGNIALPAASDPTKRWMASRGRLNNLRSSFLRFGAAGGGETEFIAVCSEGDAAINSISIWHHINDFPGEANARIKLIYSIDGEKLTTTYGQVFNDGDFQGVRNKNASFGTFYQGLAASKDASVQVGDLGALTMSLNGSAQPMMFFVNDCKTLRGEAKEALKAAGNDKTPPEKEGWNNLSRTIGAALQAEERGAIVEEAPSDQLTWNKGQATFNNKPFSYIRLDHKGYNIPSVFAACNATSSRISNVKFWFALDAGTAQSKKRIGGNYVFGDEKQRKNFKPFGQQTGYRGVTVDMPYFGSFWRTMARNSVIGLELEGVEQNAQYPLAGGHKALLTFMKDCNAFRNEAREVAKTTGADQESDLVDPNQLIQLASTGVTQPQAEPQPAPAAPTGQTAASAVGGVYRCDNGRQLQVAFAPQNAAVKVDYQGLPSMELPSVDNNAGTSFSDGFFTLVANEAEARLLWGNTTRICKR